MIRVEGLDKHYGTFHAVQDVSFEVAKGEVVGFLGPNGAGKTTTMRILCGCLGATSGRALIDGKDVLEDPTSVKHRIGYLPEAPPVYPTMIVRDYVRFAAAIKDVQDVEGATEVALRRVGLADVGHRVIAHLSKGYRQRVGLAQALVHDPDVLVLDEPTSGLDPAQRVEIRDLLRELAEGERTVILSTHVLGEIEAVCKRVIIIHQGRIVAQDLIENLSRSGLTRLRVASPGPAAQAALARVPGVAQVLVQSDDKGSGSYKIEAAPEHQGTELELRAAIAAAAVPFGLVELGAAEKLEDVYLRLTTDTGPDLRDGGRLSSTPVTEVA